MAKSKRPNFDKSSLEHLETYGESKDIQDNFHFKLFSLITDSRFTYRIIGFTEYGGEFFYILIRNKSFNSLHKILDGAVKTERWFDGKIPVFARSKFNIEEQECFTSLKSLFADDGILSKPRTGDKLLCVGNERYMGISFDHEYEAHEVYKEKSFDRVRVEEYGEYTYEGQYFIVTQRLEDSDLSGNPINQSKGKTSTSHPQENINPCGEVPLPTSEIDGLIRRTIIEKGEPNLRKIKSSGELIRRKVLNESGERERTFFEPEILRRKV